MSETAREDMLAWTLSGYLGVMRDLRHGSIDWHSATFSGARHRLAFMLADNPATAERLKAIADTDLPLARGFVADVAVTAMASTAHGLAVELDVLTIAD